VFSPQDRKLLPERQVLQQQVAARTKDLGYRNGQEFQQTQHEPVVTETQDNLAIGFSAMLYCGDLEDFARVVEAEAVVSNTQPELGRFDTLEAFHITFASANEMSQGMKDSQSRGLVNGAKLGLRLVFPGNLFHTHDYLPVLCGSGSRGVRPMHSKSSKERPNSARTSSWDMLSPRENEAREAAISRASSSLTGSSS
jgi:hypothetical protein